MKFKISVVVPLGEKRENFVLESLRKQNNSVEIIAEIGPNTSRNRNKGIKKAKNNLIAFMNGHSFAPETWSEDVISFFSENPRVDIVGGPQITPLDNNNFGRISGYALSSPFGAGGVYNRYTKKKKIFDADESDLTSANLICKKKVFEKINFDETLGPGEDPKFISDAKKAGFKIVYSPDILIYNKRRENLKSLAKQIFNYGRVRPKKERILETTKRPYFLVPAFFLVYLLFLPTLIFLHKLFIIPLFFYFLLLLLFSIYEGTRNADFPAVFLLPFIFLTIHISYGAGFLYGLIINKL